jgi:hypothetical protein
MAKQVEIEFTKLSDILPRGSAHVSIFLINNNTSELRDKGCFLVYAGMAAHVEEFIEKTSSFSMEYPVVTIHSTKRKGYGANGGGYHWFDLSFFIVAPKDLEI